MSWAVLSKSRKVSVLSDQDRKVGAKSADFAEKGTFRQESRVWKWRFCAGIPHPKAQSGPQKPKRQWIRFLGLRKAARPAGRTAPTALRSEPTFRLSTIGVCKEYFRFSCVGDVLSASAWILWARDPRRRAAIHRRQDTIPWYCRPCRGGHAESHLYCQPHPWRPFPNR